MLLEFSKYQGTGNDFILFDNRMLTLNADMQAFFAKICDRRFGIGADGIMLLQNAEGFDFEMIYLNADGRPGSLCGNGSRCMVQFVYKLGIQKNKYHFLASDGAHEAIREEETVKLKMHDVHHLEKFLHYYEADTGSPHYIEFLQTLDGMHVKEEGAKVRYSEKYKQQGINVNFAVCTTEGITMRTYERGVEDETLSCGTGVTAAALAYAVENKLLPGNYTIPVRVMGGNLQVSFEKHSDTHFSNIWLIGPAEFVFSGVVEMV